MRRDKLQADLIYINRLRMESTIEVESNAITAMDALSRKNTDGWLFRAITVGKTTSVQVSRPNHAERAVDLA